MQVSFVNFTRTVKGRHAALGLSLDEHSAVSTGCRPGTLLQPARVLLTICHYVMSFCIFSQQHSTGVCVQSVCHGQACTKKGACKKYVCIRLTRLEEQKASSCPLPNS